MRPPTPKLKHSYVSVPAATTPDNGSQANSSRNEGNFKEEAIVAALFQRLPRMLASLESFSEK